MTTGRSNFRFVNATSVESLGSSVELVWASAREVTTAVVAARIRARKRGMPVLSRTNNEDVCAAALRPRRSFRSTQKSRKTKAPGSSSGALLIHLEEGGREEQHDAGVA